MRFTLKILFIVLITFTSCKTSKKVAETTQIENVSTKKIINNHYEHVFNKQTLDARLNAKYKDQKTSVNIVVKLRIEKDKTIWMSATKMGIPFAKVKITPTNVSYYEKLEKTYFNGDFTLLSKWLGTELDYEKVQNILLGQAVLNLRKGKYDSKITNNTYELIPKKNDDLFSILFFMNPQNFKLNKQEISNVTKEQLFMVSYPNYKEIDGEQIPKNVDITAIDPKNTTTINIEYKSVEFNKKLTYPFTIPDGYKEIHLK